MNNEIFMADATSAIMRGYINIAKTKNNPSSNVANFDNNLTETPKTDSKYENSKSETAKTHQNPKQSVGSDGGAMDFQELQIKRSRKIFSIAALNTFGLKLVSCGIPKKPVGKKKKDFKSLLNEPASVSEEIKGYTFQKRGTNNSFSEQCGLQMNVDSPEKSPQIGIKAYPRIPHHTTAVSLPKTTGMDHICPLHTSKLNKRLNRARHNSSKENSFKSSSTKKTVTNGSEDKMLCVVVQGVNHKHHEIMTSLHDFQRLRRAFPKLQDVIPDVDTKENELKYSPDAVKTVLGYLFSPSYNFNAIQNEITAVEILAIIRSWEIVKFQDAFKDHFIQNILQERNANRIYSLAHNFDLDDIKETCLQLSKDIILRKHREKICTVSVNTYQESLEFSIPLEPISENLSESFDKDIINDLVFESVSGDYDIAGFAVKLNINDSTKSDMPTKLNIHYSTESTIKELNISQKTVSKSLGSTIIIYFKQNLIVKSGQKIKISVEMQTKPCLCYTLEDKSIQDKLSNGMFNLTLTSNRKALNSDKSLFLIGKIFYRLKIPTK